MINLEMLERAVLSSPLLRRDVIVMAYLREMGDGVRFADMLAALLAHLVQSRNELIDQLMLAELRQPRTYVMQPPPQEKQP